MNVYVYGGIQRSQKRVLCTRIIMDYEPLAVNAGNGILFLLRVANV